MIKKLRINRSYKHKLENHKFKLRKIPIHPETFLHKIEKFKSISKMKLELKYISITVPKISQQEMVNFIYYHTEDGLVPIYKQKIIDIIHYFINRNIHIIILLGKEYYKMNFIKRFIYFYCFIHPLFKSLSNQELVTIIY
jgi:hypothetical protein